MHWTIRLLRGIEISFYVLFFTCILGGSSLLVYTKPSEAARRYTRSVEFDFVSWTLDALSVKLDQAALGTPFYFDDNTRHQIVVDYLHLIDNILAGENRLNLLFSDPKVHNPAAASLSLQAELAQLYTRQHQLAPLAEAVLQEQISATLAEQGLTTGGQPLPPVLFHITPLPYDLVISPRDKIEQAASISLIPDLSVDQQITLENQVDSSLNVSSLVVPVGGIGTYPTMVMRTTALDWLADTIAHEWTHNWLTLQPLGLNYDTTPELRTMNETTASITGQEISVLVLKRYYPELAVEYNVQTINQPLAPKPVAFDFNNEMHITRVHVDELLAQGKVTEAEFYMAQRRLLFWQNGYAIRKLNQAYFAFYGAYAHEPGGAAGEDPVGPAVRALRAQSASLAYFLKTIARMSSFQQLQATISR
ncbi:MAG TPA: hypothetical protein VII93_15365 [Anaerolineales bacterium]